MKQFPSGLTRMSDLRAHKEMLGNVHNFHPDAILLDYADLLIPERADPADLHSAGAEIYNQFRGWMVEDRLVGWTGLQSGRGAMEATIADQQHTGGSIAKAQIADLIISINRTAEEDKKGLTNLFIVKNREGPARYGIVIKTDFNKMSFWTRGEE